MSTPSRKLQRGALAGLALLLGSQAGADESLRGLVREQLQNHSYVLVEDGASTRLYVLSDTVDAMELPKMLQPPTASIDAALAMIHSADQRRRVRGLTLLAGTDDPAARDAALTLLSDPAEAVREEAYSLLLEHPAADRDGIVAMGSTDPSPRVREAIADAQDDDIGD